MPSPHDGTGAYWDETHPDIDSPHGLDYQEIKDLRKGVAVRIGKEHDTLDTSNGGGEHKQGSAKIYVQTTEPTKRPDDTTDLDADDLGRIWLDTTDNVVKILTAIGTPNTWTAFSEYVSTSIETETLTATTKVAIEGILAIDEVVADLSALLGTSKGVIGIENDGTNDEFCLVDANGNKIQLTEAGKIKFSSLNNLANDTYLKAIDSVGTGTVDMIKVGRNEADDADVVVLPDAARTATNAAPTEDTGLANKKYVDDSSKDGFTPSSYAGEQSVTLPNGLIMKFGYVTRTGNSTPVSFGSNFSTVKSITVTPVYNATGGVYTVYVDNITVSGFNIKEETGYTGYYWFAIGY